MSSTLQLLLSLGIIIFAAKAGGLLATRLRQPAVLGELLVGLLLGPSLLNLFGLPVFHDGHTEELIHELAELGVIFLMFVAGLEVDVNEMLRSGKVAMFGGVLGVIVPLVLGTGVALAFGQALLPSIFVGLILTATSVSISAQTLLELGMLRTKEGLGLLGAAVVDDVVAILCLSIFLALTGTGASGSTNVFVVIILMALYLALGIGIGARFLPRLTNRIERLPVSEGLMAWVIVSTLIYAWAAEFVGQIAAITGAFLAGTFFGRTHLRDDIHRGMHTITYAFFVPIFLVNIGLRANLRELDTAGIVFSIALIGVAIISKVVGSGLGARLGGFDNLAAFRVGLGMVSRGEVGLIVATIGLGAGLVTSQEYSQVVVMVLATTLVTPVLLRWAFSLGKYRAESRAVEPTPAPDA